jgi:hypothetical protein
MGAFSLANLSGAPNMQAPQMRQGFGAPAPYQPWQGGIGDPRAPAVGAPLPAQPGLPGQGGIGDPRAPMMPPQFGGAPMPPVGGIGDPRGFGLPPRRFPFGGFGGGFGGFGEGNPMMQLHQLNGLGMMSMY